MKSLHQRFKQEDIVINYPMRTLQFPKEWGPEAMMQRNGQDSEANDEEGAEGTEKTRQRSRRRPPKTLHVTEEMSGAETDTPDSG